MFVAFSLMSSGQSVWSGSRKSFSLLSRKENVIFFFLPFAFGWRAMPFYNAMGDFCLSAKHIKAIVSCPALFLASKR